MKRWEIIAGLILLLIGMLVAPRQLWLLSLKHRVQAVREAQAKCGFNIPCLDRLVEEMRAVNFELEHPPWYVVGGVGSIAIDK